jgi:hypothetical protein
MHTEKTGVKNVYGSIYPSTLWGQLFPFLASGVSNNGCVCVIFMSSNSFQARRPPFYFYLFSLQLLHSFN